MCPPPGWGGPPVAATHVPVRSLQPAGGRDGRAGAMGSLAGKVSLSDSSSNQSSCPGVCGSSAGGAGRAGARVGVGASTGSALVAFDGAHIAHARLGRVVAELALGSALAQEVPALVELLGHLLEAGAVVGLGHAVGAQPALFVDESADMVEDAGV